MRFLQIALLTGSLISALFAGEIAGGSAGNIESARLQAADFLLSRLGEDAMWVFPPESNRIRIGTNEKIQRYREVEVEVPVLVEREILVRRRGDSGGAVGRMEKRTVRVPDPDGRTQKEVRQIRDPEGPIRRKVFRPVWGEGGPDQWSIGQMGHNALVYAALLRSGHPGAVDAVTSALDFYQFMVEEIGAPEATWDLAWLIILFAETESSIYHDLVPDMVDKLMSAQICEGPGRGLWGPLAVNPEVLSAHWRNFQEASAEYNRVVDRVGKEPTRTSHLQRLGEARRAVERERKKLDRYSWSFGRPEINRVTEDLGWDTGIQIQINRMLEYPFNQFSADMESTWLSLLAIRLAYEKGLVPSTLHFMEQSGDRRTPAVEPPTPLQILRKAAIAIADQAHSSGGYKEANLHQPVRAFDEMTSLPGVPIGIRSFDPLPSPVTLSASAQGYAGLLHIAAIVGIQEIHAQASTMVRTKALLDAQLDQALSGEPEHIGGSGLGVAHLVLALTENGPDITSAPRDLEGDLLEFLLEFALTWQPTEFSASPEN